MNLTAKTISLCLLMVAMGCTGRALSPTPTPDVRLTSPLPTRTATATATHAPTVTPSPMATSTWMPRPTATPIIWPTCTPLPPGVFYVLSDWLFASSLSDEGVQKFEAALAQAYPEWAALQIRYGDQDWSIGPFLQAISGPGSWAAASPEVMVVTLGVKYDWQIPGQMNLADEFISSSISLTKEYADFLKRPEIHRQYPQVGNAATYALYRYFNGDVQKLQEWHATYVWVFGYDPRWGTSTTFPRPGWCEREPLFSQP